VCVCLRKFYIYILHVCVRPQDEYIHFLRDSQHEALMEEERRYRFLAEKHCGLTQSIVYLMNKVV
jgi:hypothetical protein